MVVRYSSNTRLPRIFHSQIHLQCWLRLPKEVGKDNITDDIAKQIKNVLQKEQKENVLADEALMPAWIRTFTRQAYE